ncbi:hypothetical protein G6F57_019361 [Rhizopus arrhizus]|nr:hypothetical protein G6F57_019361 [Rhizopus arrhizus]
MHDGARAPVDGQRPELQMLRRLVQLIVPAHQRAYPGQQHARLHGFDDVIVGAGLQPQDLVQVVLARGQHQDGRGRERAQIAAHLQAIPSRQHQIQDGDRRLVAAERFHGVVAAVGLGDVEPVLLQELRDQARELGIVFN